MKNSITLKAVTENLQSLMSFVSQPLKVFPCSPKTEMQIKVAAEEIFVNIAHYAYPSETEGYVTVDMEVTEDPLIISITFTDSGIPYDPLAKPDPDITLPAQERQIGGLGIYLVKKMMDEINYIYSNHQNILKIQKRLS